MIHTFYKIEPYHPPPLCIKKYINLLKRTSSPFPFSFSHAQSVASSATCPLNISLIITLSDSLIHAFLPWQIVNLLNSRIKYILVFPAPYGHDCQGSAHVLNPLPHQCTIRLPNTNACTSLFEGFLWPKPLCPPLWQTRSEDKFMPPWEYSHLITDGSWYKILQLLVPLGRAARRVCLLEVLMG